MIHVPDVRATLEWYEAIGFTVLKTYEEDQELSWAWLAFGMSEVMFNEGGRPSSAHRREVDLYVFTEEVEAMYERLQEQAEVVEALHETAYGMREFIVRDLNRYWLTFGQELRPVA